MNRLTSWQTNLSVAIASDSRLVPPNRSERSRQTETAPSTNPFQRMRLLYPESPGFIALPIAAANQLLQHAVSGGWHLPSGWRVVGGTYRATTVHQWVALTLRLWALVFGCRFIGAPHRRNL